MKKIILELLILSAMLLCSCIDESSQTDVTTQPTENDTTTNVTTELSEAHTTSSAVTTVETTNFQISEADLWIAEKYSNDIERITDFVDDKVIEYYDLMENGYGPETPNVYFLLSDMNFDGLPEVIMGHTVKIREQKLYELYSYDLVPQEVVFLVPETCEPFDSKVYVDNSGRKYFYTSMFSGTVGYVRYHYTEIWFDGEKWVKRNDESNQEKPNDKYEYILIASVEINPDNIKNSVEQCFIEYYSQIYDEDGNRLEQ